MAVDVLLINPWIYDFAAYDLWARPLGLFQIGAKLRQVGYQVALLDALDPFHPELPKPPRRKSFGTGHYFRQPVPKPVFFSDVPRRFARYGMPAEVFKQELKRLGPPKVILVTSLMTYWYPGVVEAVRLAKEIYPEVPVLLGGVYATLCPEHARTMVGADLVFSGPEDESLLKAVQDLVKPSGAKAPHPYPVFDLQTRIPYVVIATSYGCPFGCPYCASKLLQPTFRQRDPEEVASEIEFWHKSYGVIDFAFYDDALLLNFDHHLGVILDKILSKGLKLRFHTPNALHLRFITPEVAHLLYQAGFETLRFGLETADPKRRAKLDHKVSVEDLPRAMAYLREAGFRGEQLGVYLLWGLPDQDFEEVKASARYVAYHGASPYLAEYSPIPKTELYQEALRVSRYPLDEDPLFHNNSCFPCLSKPDWEAIEETKRYVRALRAEVKARSTPRGFHLKPRPF